LAKLKINAGVLNSFDATTRLSPSRQHFMFLKSVGCFK